MKEKRRYESPLEEVENQKGQPVTVKSEEGEFDGTLVSVDGNLNVVIQNSEGMHLFRGTSVHTIEFSNEEV